MTFFLILLALITNLVLAIFLVVFLGAFAGVSWVSGFTMLGSEVEDEVRGRTFAFVQSLIRITLVLVLAVAPAIAAWIGRHTFKFRHLQDKTVEKVELTHGSFVLMQGETQHKWEHEIPKTSKTLTPRINLTFRVIK